MNSTVNFLALAALANSIVHDKDTGRRQLRTARDYLAAISNKKSRAQAADAIATATKRGEY